MTDRSGDVDPDALREDLDAIKDAMGLEERYRGVSTLWVVLGALVAVAAVLSQVVHTWWLPLGYHTAIWLTVLGAGGYVGARGIFGDVRRAASSGSGPDVLLQFAAIYLATIPIQVAVAPALETGSYVGLAATSLGLNLVLVGVGHLVVANSLKAYAIRRRDRLAVAAGGVWLVPLGAAIPRADVLREWGYVTFGVLYLAYAVASYAVLTRSGEPLTGGDHQ